MSDLPNGLPRIVQTLYQWRKSPPERNGGTRIPTIEMPIPLLGAILCLDAETLAENLDDLRGKGLIVDCPAKPLTVSTWSITEPHGHYNVGIEIEPDNPGRLRVFNPKWPNNWYATVGEGEAVAHIKLAPEGISMAASKPSRDYRHYANIVSESLAELHDAWNSRLHGNTLDPYFQLARKAEHNAATVAALLPAGLAENCEVQSVLGVTTGLTLDYTYWGETLPKLLRCWRGIVHQTWPTERPITVGDFERAKDAAIGAIFESIELICCAITEPESSQHGAGTIQLFRLAATVETFCAWLDTHRGLIDRVHKYILPVVEKPVSHDGLIAPTAHKLAWDNAHRLWLTVKNVVDMKSIIASGQIADLFPGSFRLDRATLDEHWEPIRDALKARQAPDWQNIKAMIEIESAKAVTQWRGEQNGAPPQPMPTNNSCSELANPSNDTGGAFSATELATRHDVPKSKRAAFAKQLQRARGGGTLGDADVVVSENPAKNKPKFLFRETLKVREIIAEYR